MDNELIRFIMLDENKCVIGVRKGTAIAEGEIQSDEGKIGQIMQGDGSFIAPEPIPVEVRPTLEEEIQSLKQDNLILMDALASTFEKMLMLEVKLDSLGGGV